MLEAINLRKRYGAVTALDGFDLTIAAGEIVGLIGHNGAGKTTFAEIVTGLVRPDGGQVRVVGIDVRRSARAARAHIGYAPQELGLYPTATLRQNLALFGRLHGLRRRGLARAIEVTADDLVLTEVLDRPVGVLSGGQKRRAQAATALLQFRSMLVMTPSRFGRRRIEVRSGVPRVVRVQAGKHIVQARIDKRGGG